MDYANTKLVQFLEKQKPLLRMSISLQGYERLQRIMSEIISLPANS